MLANLSGELTLVAELHILVPVPGIYEELAFVNPVPYPMLPESLERVSRKHMGHESYPPSSVLGGLGTYEYSAFTIDY